MQVAAYPPDEQGRLAELQSYEVLDTSREAAFDDLTRLASQLCDTPIALVSIVDAERQWFKAQVGLPANETARHISFCAHAILQDDVFEIPDAAEDLRFADNPLVTGDPKIRFYAGIPLRSPQGHALGTVCVIDRTPRQLTSSQREGLQAIGRQVMTQLELRRRLRALGRPQPRPSDLRTLPPLDPSTSSPLAAQSGVTYVERDDETDGASGLKFSRYTILRQLGQGGMATVYAAYDEELDRKVALKLLHARGDVDSSRKIQREAQALARISHPNVVQIYAIALFGAQNFIAMELVEGVTLAAWQRAEPRELVDLLGVYVQAGRGLVAAHQAGIVHRDFKPDNVLVGNDGRARIADFGLALVLGGEQVAAEANRAIGTPAYMSPEQHGALRVDEKADQFSFCASLYEALYGVRPFEGATIAEVRAQAIAGAVRPPPADHRVPPTLHAVLARGLSVDPAQRWSSLTELLDRLAAFDPRSDPSSARNERRTFAAALLAAVVAIAGLQTWEHVYAPEALTTEHLLALAMALLVAAALGVVALGPSLLLDAFHRRRVGLLLSGFALSLVIRGVTTVADMAVADVMLVELLCGGLLALFIAPLSGRLTYATGSVCLLGALAIAQDAPAVPIASVCLLISTALFLRGWSRAAAPASR